MNSFCPIKRFGAGEGPDSEGSMCLSVGREDSGTPGRQIGRHLFSEKDAEAREGS